ncbi:MAG: acetamidase/formamidase family protein, partial [Acidobacteriota bacterium]
CAPDVDAPSDAAPPAAEAGPATPEPQFALTRDQTHNKFSSTVAPILTVTSGAVLAIETEEASDGQLTVDSVAADVPNVSFEPIHPLTGPVYVEGAEPGDVLKVTLHKITVGDWGWTGIFPGFGFLAERFPDAALRTYRFDPGATHADFGDGVQVPLRPFPGVIAVAPATEEMLSTIPPRANGGNMDDRDMAEGSTVYLPVFVDGALFSIGDGHAAQGDGEVCGTAIEAPLDLIVQLDVVKGGRPIPEPQYENGERYSVTAFGVTIDEAAKKATGYMVDYLVAEHGQTPEDAYMLASIAADLKIAEVVDLPHVLVTMSINRSVFR